MPDNADLVYFNVRCHLAPVVADISQDSDYDPNVDRRIDAVVTFTPKYRTGEVIHAHTTLPPTGFLVMPVTALIDDGYLKLRTKPDTGAAPLPGTLHGLKAKIAADTGRELPAELDTRDALNYAPVRLLGNSTTLEIDPEYPLYYDFSFSNVKVDGKATNITITGGTFEAPWEMDATIDLLDYMPLTPGPNAVPMVVGPPGPQGPEGPPGPAGGPPGPQGPAGLGIRYAGEVQSVEELDAITGQIQGDLWVVGNRNDDGTPAESYVWDEAKQDWIYAGYIQGVQGVPGPAGSVGPAGPAGPVGPAGADSTVPGPAGPEGPAGAVGPAGPAGADSTVPGPAGADGVDGAAATVEVGSTTTGAEGTNAAVTNTGTSSAAVLEFTIPAGERGVQGIPGDPGPEGPEGPQGIQGEQGIQGIPGLGIRFKGEVASIAELPTDAVQGDLWVIGNRDDDSLPAESYVWDETTTSWVYAGKIQGAQGVQGPQGVAGSDGADGQAATVEVGATVTGAAGTSASVVNTGTSGAAVFEFTIPVGATGPAGPAGADSTVPGPAGPAGADSTVPGPVGPAGPTAVSADAANTSVLGTDGLVFTPSVLDANGRLPESALPDGVELIAAKGQPLGYAPLDDRSMIPAEFLPADIGVETMAELTDVTPVGLAVGTAVDEPAARAAIEATPWAAVNAPENYASLQAAVTGVSATPTQLRAGVSTYTLPATLSIRNDTSLDLTGSVLTQAANTNLDKMVELNISETTGYVRSDVSLVVDGNRDNNTTDVTGVRVGKIKKALNETRAAILNCDTGLRVDGSTEYARFNLSTESCGIGLHLVTTSTDTWDELIVDLIAAHGVTALKTDGPAKGSATIRVTAEQCSGWGADINIGWLELSGILRGCGTAGDGTGGYRQGFQSKADGVGAGALAVRGNLAVVCGGTGTPSTGWAVDLCYGKVVGMQFHCLGEYAGGLRVANGVTGSVMVDLTSNPQSAEAVLLYDPAGTSTLNAFHILPGSRINASTGVAVNFDRASNCIVEPSYITGQIRFSSVSQGNFVRIPRQCFSLVSFVNERTANDNRVVFTGRYSKVQLDGMAVKFVGMMAEQVVDFNNLPAFWNGTAWTPLETRALTDARYSQLGHTHVAGDVVGALSWTTTVPATPSAAGTRGQFTSDGQFLYVCVTSGAAGAAAWKRLAFEIWI
jgi:hypothetical protein